MCSPRNVFSTGKHSLLVIVGHVLAPGTLFFELVGRWIQLGDEGRGGQWHRYRWTRGARESAGSVTLIKFCWMFISDFISLDIQGDSSGRYLGLVVIDFNIP